MKTKNRSTNKPMPKTSKRTRPRKWLERLDKNLDSSRCSFGQVGAAGRRSPGEEAAARTIVPTLDVDRIHRRAALVGLLSIGFGLSCSEGSVEKTQQIQAANAISETVWRSPSEQRVDRTILNYMATRTLKSDLLLMSAHRYISSREGKSSGDCSGPAQVLIQGCRPKPTGLGLFAHMKQFENDLKKVPGADEILLGPNSEKAVDALLSLVKKMPTVGESVELAESLKDILVLVGNNHHANRAREQQIVDSFKQNREETSQLIEAGISSAKTAREVIEMMEELLHGDFTNVPLDEQARRISLGHTLSRFVMDQTQCVHGDPTCYAPGAETLAGLKTVIEHGQKNGYKLDELKNMLPQLFEGLSKQNAVAIDLLKKRDAQDRKLCDSVDAPNAQSPGDCLATLLIERQKKATAEQRKLAQQQQVLKQLPWQTTEAGIYLIGQLLGVYDEAAGRHIQTLGSAALKIARSLDDYVFLSEFASPEQMGMGTAVLTGNVVGVVMTIFAAGGSKDGMILEQLQAIRQDIANLREVMDQRFDRLDSSLNRLEFNVIRSLKHSYDAMLAGFDLITTQNDVTHDKLMDIQRALINVNTRLTRLENSIGAWSEEDLRQTFLSTRGRFLNYREHYPGRELEWSGFEEAESAFFFHATSQAKGVLAGAGNAPTDNKGALEELRGKPLSREINYLADVAVERFASELRPHGVGRLANPTDWMVASEAYAQLYEEWPKHSTRKNVNPQRLESVIQVGENLKTVLDKVSTRALVLGLIDNYQTSLEDLRKAVDAYRTNVFEHNRNLTDIDLWGQIRATPSMRRTAAQEALEAGGGVRLCDESQPPLRIPDLNFTPEGELSCKECENSVVGRMWVNLFNALPDSVLFARALGGQSVRSIDTCIKAHWQILNGHVSSTGKQFARHKLELVASYGLEYHWPHPLADSPPINSHHFVHGDAGELQRWVSGELDDLQSCRDWTDLTDEDIDYSVVVSGPRPWRYGRLCRGVPNPYDLERIQGYHLLHHEASDNDDVLDEAIRSSLRETLLQKQSTLYEEISSQLDAVGEVNTAARNVDGAVELLRAFMALGFPAFLQESDLFRFLVFGDGLLDAKAIVNVYDAAAASPPSHDVLSQLDVPDRLAALEELLLERMASDTNAYEAGYFLDPILDRLKRLRPCEIGTTRPTDAGCQDNPFSRSIQRCNDDYVWTDTAECELLPDIKVIHDLYEEILGQRQPLTCEMNHLLMLRGGESAWRSAITKAAQTSSLFSTCDADGDGVIDNNGEGNAPCFGSFIGESCSIGVGVCEAQGIATCDNGITVCSAQPSAPSAELCDGLDNDCDGLIDEQFDVGAVCTVGLGACRAAGFLSCRDGDSACNAQAGTPSAEICDGIDNDCDGIVDENCVKIDLSYSGGGHVTSDPAPMNGMLLTGSTVTFTAQPKHGHRLAGWTGNCTGATPTCRFTVPSQSVSVAARFEGPNFTYQAESQELAKATGQASSGGWAAATQVHEAGHLIYGPYAAYWSARPHTAFFRMMVDNVTAGGNIARIDIHDYTTKQILKTQIIRRSDFDQPFTFKDFPLTFDLTGRSGHAIETRVYWYDTSYLKVDQIAVVEGYVSLKDWIP